MVRPGFSAAGQEEKRMMTLAVRSDSNRIRIRRWLNVGETVGDGP